MTYRGQEAWGALALAAAMLRLVVYAIVIVAALFLGSGFALGNDEPIAARLLGLPSLSFVGLLAPLFAGVVWTVTRTFHARWYGRVGHLLGLGLTTLALGIFVGRILDPWIFGAGMLECNARFVALRRFQFFSKGT